MDKLLVHNLFVDYGQRKNEIESSAQIGHSFPFQEPTPIPPFPERFKAIWDTGATGTSISEDIAIRLQLRHCGQVDVQGVTGTSACNTYLLALHLLQGVIIPELEVTGCIENIGCDILIGMDVINMGDFAICNKRGITTFSFRVPSTETINFTLLGEHDIKLDEIGRNSPCFCGSGKKLKQCCGHPSKI